MPKQSHEVLTTATGGSTFMETFPRRFGGGNGARRFRCLRPRSRRMLAPRLGRPRDRRRSLVQHDNDPRPGPNRQAAARDIPAGPRLQAGGPFLTRRSMMKAMGFGAAAVAGPGLVAGCSGSGGGRTSIVFEETKPEVVPYFNNLVAKFNAMQSEVTVTHDFTSNLIAEFEVKTWVTVTSDC